MDRRGFIKKSSFLATSMGFGACASGVVDKREKSLKPVGIEKYQFEGSISRDVLENYLSRSMTMMFFLTGHANTDDDIRLY